MELEISKHAFLIVFSSVFFENKQKTLKKKLKFKHNTRKSTLTNLLKAQAAQGQSKLSLINFLIISLTFEEMKPNN